jgi:hypothetical protein
VEKKEDCTVKNIRRVNVRFILNKNICLANDSTEEAKGADFGDFYTAGSEEPKETTD